MATSHSGCRLGLGLGLSLYKVKLINGYYCPLIDADLFPLTIRLFGTPVHHFGPNPKLVPTVLTCMRIIF